VKVIGNAMLSIAVLSVGLAALQASADEGDQTRSVVVKYGDLDLAAADGASALYQRLKHAAREVCKRSDGGFGDPTVWLHCYHNALAGAVRDLSNASVIALYNGEHRVGIPPATATLKSTK
jgi:UrcA family protein